MQQVDAVPQNLRDSGLLANLPTLPGVGFEIVRLSKDPDSSIDDLAAVIQRDPALSVRLVTMANSPAYLRREPVTSVKDAALLMGRQTISLVALSFSLAGGMDRTGSPSGLDLELYWRRSLTVAAVARHVARNVCRAHSETAFLAGLLAHLGKMVLAQNVGPQYRPVVEAAGGWPSLRDERDGLGWDSLDVTLAVLREWGLPEEVAGTIESGLDEDRVVSDGAAVAELTPVLALAAAADTSLNDPSNPDGHALVEARAQLMFGDDHSVFEGLDDALAEAGELLDIRLPGDTNADDLVAQARQRMVEATMAVATQNQQQAQRLEDLQRQNTELEAQAATDGLTGLPNRRTFDESLARECSRRGRGTVAAALGIVMIDIDHFKNVNDTYGHAFGDEVLVAVARAMEAVVRNDETIHRYGGEEFVLLAPSCDPAGLEVVGERLRSTVEDLELSHDGEPVPVTISVGAACATDAVDERDGGLLVQKADGLLYRAKKGGRNRVEVSRDTIL